MVEPCTGWHPADGIVQPLAYLLLGATLSKCRTQETSSNRKLDLWWVGSTILVAPKRRHKIASLPTWHRWWRFNKAALYRKRERERELCSSFAIVATKKAHRAVRSLKIDEEIKQIVNSTSDVSGNAEPWHSPDLSLEARRVLPMVD